MMWRWFGSAGFVGLLSLAACGQTVREFGNGGEAGTSGTTTSTGGTGAGTGGTGTASKAPKLVKSAPETGDAQAALTTYFLLYFDRPMSYAGATGKIRVSSDVVTTPTFAQVGPCPDADATCVAGSFPDSFADPVSKKLPGGTKHTIVIDKSFADPDGNTLEADIEVTFTTFKYNNNVVDDSAAISQEVGGIDFDPVSKNLFVCGDSSATNTLNIRRVPLVGDMPGSPTSYDVVDTTNTGGSHCYGLDVVDGRLLVSHTYGARALVYEQLGMPPANGPWAIVGPSTSLAAPDDRLDNLQSMTTVGGKLLLANGYYYVTPPFTGILSYDAGLWGVWLPATNNFDASEGVMITRGNDTQGEHVYVLAKTKILKVSGKTAMLENQHTLDDQLYDAQIRVDSQGRLYVGSSSGITVYDTSGGSGFKVIASRPGIRAGRFGLAEKGNDVAAFYVDFRDKAIIGSTLFQY